MKGNHLLNLQKEFGFASWKNNQICSMKGTH